MKYENTKTGVILETSCECQGPNWRKLDEVPVAEGGHTEKSTKEVKPTKPTRPTKAGKTTKTTKTPTRRTTKK